MTKLTTLENLPPHTLTTPQLRRVVATLTTRAVRSLRKDELLVLLKAINAHWALYSIGDFKLEQNAPPVLGVQRVRVRVSYTGRSIQL